MSDMTFVYGLSCSCHPEKGIRYIGQTVKGAKVRLSGHRAEARAGIRSYKNTWIRSHGPDAIRLEILEVVADPADLDAAEIRWIADCRELGMADTNHSAGGPGSPRVRKSNALRNATSAMNKNRPRSESQIESVAKLTESQAMGIIGRSDESPAALAAEYGVSGHTIRNVIRGITWKHLDRSAAPSRWPTAKRLPAAPRGVPTHCFHGHDYSIFTWKISAVGSYVCRECQRLRPRLIRSGLSKSEVSSELDRLAAAA